MFVFSYSALVYFKKSHLKPSEISFFLSEFFLRGWQPSEQDLYMELGMWNEYVGESCTKQQCFQLQIVMKAFFSPFKPVLFSNLATH